MRSLTFLAELSFPGVDDGHFQKVLDDEVRALQNACRALYMNHPLPKITFIIVKKRHNTRFFVPDPERRMMQNVQPGLSHYEFIMTSILPRSIGTVVDTDIVHPYGFDFYLNSHAAILGRYSRTSVDSYDSMDMVFRDLEADFVPCSV